MMQIQHNIPLCHKFVSMICPKRFLEKILCSTIVSAIHNVYQGSEQGIDFINQTIDSYLVDEEIKTFVEKIYQNPKENKTIKTLAWFARCDQPENYQNWICDINDPVPMLYRKYFLDWVAIQKFAFKQNKSQPHTTWYQFDNHRWKKIENPDESVKSCESLLRDSLFERKLDYDPHLTGMENGCTEQFDKKFYFRDSIPEDYIQMSVGYHMDKSIISSSWVTNLSDKFPME